MSMETVRTVLERLPAECPPKSEADALALAVHACLEMDGMRCVAISEGDAAQSQSTPPASPGPLPSGWNASEDMYVFIYRHASSQVKFL